MKSSTYVSDFAIPHSVVELVKKALLNQMFPETRKKELPLCATVEAILLNALKAESKTKEKLAGKFYPFEVAYDNTSNWVDNALQRWEYAVPSAYPIPASLEDGVTLMLMKHKTDTAQKDLDALARIKTAAQAAFDRETDEENYYNHRDSGFLRLSACRFLILDIGKHAKSSWICRYKGDDENLQGEYFQTIWSEYHNKLYARALQATYLHPVKNFASGWDLMDLEDFELVEELT